MTGGRGALTGDEAVQEDEVLAGNEAEEELEEREVESSTSERASGIIFRRSAWKASVVSALGSKTLNLFS